MSCAAAHFVRSTRSGPQTIRQSVDLPGGQIIQPFLCQFPLDVSHCYVIVTLRIGSPWGGDVTPCDYKECRSIPVLCWKTAARGIYVLGYGSKPKATGGRKKQEGLGE